MRIFALVLVLLSSVLMLSGCNTSCSTVPAKRVVIVTRAPAPKEVIVVPRHYHCHIVPAGWYNNMWIPAHKVCTYSHAAVHKQVWVPGYWQCDTFNGNVCNNWTWVSGHWADQGLMY